MHSLPVCCRAAPTFHMMRSCYYPKLVSNQDSKACHQHSYSDHTPAPHRSLPLLHQCHQRRGRPRRGAPAAQRDCVTIRPFHVMPCRCLHVDSIWLGGAAGQRKLGTKAVRQVRSLLASCGGRTLRQGMWKYRSHQALNSGYSCIRAAGAGRATGCQRDEPLAQKTGCAGAHQRGACTRRPCRPPALHLGVVPVAQPLPKGVELGKVLLLHVKGGEVAAAAVPHLALHLRKGWGGCVGGHLCGRGGWNGGRADGLVGGWQAHC